MSGWKPILYLITPDYIGEGFFRLVEDALDGGPDVLQYRDKKSTRQTRTEVARRLRRMCHDRGVAFVVDDDPYVARDSGADLLHVGRDDPSIEEAREVVGNMPIGSSSYCSTSLARDLERRGSAYVAFGAFFRSPSKPEAALCDKKTITEGLRAVRIPVYAIGGISQTNVKPLLEQGVSGVAVISSVFSSENPKRAVLEYSGILAEYRCDRDPLSWFRRAGQAGP
ncbi:thiamine-phosphate synthase [Thermogymnomonas acidicola]|uniref:Thiamine-phosphate synthase n=1 Tax=Thermogymnomonas acidicola TaxID=399579 RepID=A0AA37BPA7_9ARCH|nr:thiamine phosphate synthase [Thermogymnomonas acidicola]GGM66180.1 thiamine-phosphate synthase [Thermogymnomonas acidicola]